MGWQCWIIYRSPRFKKDHQTPNLRAVSCNWIIHYMWQLFPLEADWEINNQGIKSRTVELLFLFPLWPITSPQFKHLQCHSELWHFLARSRSCTHTDAICGRDRCSDEKDACLKRESQGSDFVRRVSDWGSLNWSCKSTQAQIQSRHEDSASLSRWYRYFWLISDLEL